MKTQFPAQGQNFTYIQTNRSDSIGSLWATMATDFQSDLETLRIAPRLMISTNTTDQANLGTPIAFEYWDFTLWAIGGTRVFSNTGAPNTGFTEDASTGAQTNYSSASDLAVFDSRLWASTDTGLYSKVGNGGGTGAWTLRTSSNWLSNADHILTYFPTFNRLYYQPQAGIIGSIDTTNTIASTAYTLNLPNGLGASCMVANEDYIWIGISGNSNGQPPIAVVYQWDGISSAPTKIFSLKSRWVLAMTVYENIVYLIDGNGVLSKFNGYTFDEIGRLPFIPQQPVADFVQRNGMLSTRNATIEVVVNNLNGDNLTTYENIPSGVWEWASKFGFTQKNVFTYLENGSSDITDYGQNRISLPGAIFDVSALLPFVVGRNGSILVGADYYTDATTVTSGIFFDDINDTKQKKGYFITVWYFSDEIQNKWNRLWTVFKRLTGATDSIVFKYRLYEEPPVVATITWTSTTTFTTTTDITAYAPDAPGFNGTTGGEVEILNGTGGASCAHITSVVDVAGTYTVTLDEEIVGVTNGTAVARFQKWIKMFPIVTGNIKSWEQFAINQNNTRICIKGCFTFTGEGEFDKFTIYSNEDIKVTP